MSIDEILLECEEKMQKSEEHVVLEFNGVRTGKASPALIENIMVEVYGGSHMRIRELAGITAPEPRQLLVQPWDMSTVGAIEKAIQKANIGLNPAVQGKVLRIMIPELSTEQREKFVKAVRHMCENGRVAIRHVRREAIEHLKKEQKAGTITEDELKHGEKEVQTLTDSYIKRIDDHLHHKEKEIMTV
ncbi:MAG: ribosome recycling factor [Verrucomicrobiales bacterium]|nr:ribosome recycling factor [Verrucomicrobiales bacterium]